MSEQAWAERAQRHVEATEEELAIPAGASGSGVDYAAVLDEIDAVLETNAAEYVRSFVQKGGQ